MRFKNFIFSLLCFYLLFVISSYAQDFSNQHWYFGNTDVAIEFARPNYAPTLLKGYKKTPFNIKGKGNATANRNETGDLLFYTDGMEVFDATHNFIDGISTGNKLDADVNKNQSVGIATIPNSKNNSYYIFTNTATGNIHYSKVDMTSVGNAKALQPSLGTVISKNNIIANSTANASDAMLIISDKKQNYWLITLDAGTNDYKVLGINSSAPATWTETTYSLGKAIDAAHIAYSPRSDKIAVASKNKNTNIQLLNIDINTGVLTFDKEISNSGVNNVAATGEAIFDVEFSNDGSKIYYSIFGDGLTQKADLMQFNLLDKVKNVKPHSVLPAAIFGSYGLQKGPDGNLYHLYQKTKGGAFLIGSLADIDFEANLTTYTAAIKKKKDFNSFQFPAVLPNRAPIFTKFTFTSAGNCANSSTTFYPNISPAPTSIEWDFGDGNSIKSLAPFHTYSTASAMNVTMKAELNGRFKSITIPITISDLRAKLTLPSDTVACQCELPKYGTTCTPFSVTVKVKNDPGNLTYKWSNGQTGTILRPDSAGYYYVVATNGTCSLYAGVEVQEYDISIPGIAPKMKANVWYFGDEAGIDFKGGAKAITDGKMNAMEGCTAASDLNGDVIFYTDGDIIFNKKHIQIDTGLGGTPNVTGAAAQAVVTAAVPEDEALFYIFTTQSTDPSSPEYNFSYSLFDLKQNKGLGAVVEKNVVLFSKSTERIAISDNWVVIHEYGNNNFRAYPISNIGIGQAVVSSIGEDYSTISADNGKGYMKIGNISRNGGMNIGVAVVENKGGVITSFLDVFDFDSTTGKVSNFRRANLTDKGGAGTAYGIEFKKPKIFVSLNKAGNAQIMEYWLDYKDNLRLNKPIMNAGFELGAMQTGPDGQLYVAENGNTTLGKIFVNADTLKASSYNASSFSLAGKTSQLGLPNFVWQKQTPTLASGMFVSSPTCIGQPITLSTSKTSSIDEVAWEVKNPEGNIIFTSAKLNNTITLNAIGNYTVKLSIMNRCLTPISVYTKNITIKPPLRTPDLPKNTFLCGNSINLPVYATPPDNIKNLKFAWSTGAITPSISTKKQGNYTVVITDITSGCSVSATTFVGPPIIIDLGKNRTICKNDILVLDSKVNADTYVWSIDGKAQLDNDRFFDVNAQNLADGTYTIQVKATIDLGNSIAPCTVTDQVRISIKSILVTTNLPTSAIVFCPEEPNLVLDAGPNFINYQWNDALASTTQSIKISKGGIYKVAVTNKFGCTAKDEVEVIEDCKPTVSGPNAFRPRGINSTYSLFTEYIENFEIFIYNRWGGLVYNSKDRNFAWDGTGPNGKISPPGQYSWVVRYTNPYRNRGMLEQYGGVVLLR